LRIASLESKLAAQLDLKRDSDMRNPRNDPRKGDVLEHQSGEKRSVIQRHPEDSLVCYREGSTVAECSETQWQEWAKQTSILNLG